MTFRKKITVAVKILTRNRLIDYEQISVCYTVNHCGHQLKEHFPIKRRPLVIFHRILHLIRVIHEEKNIQKA